MTLSNEAAKSILVPADDDRYALALHDTHAVRFAAAIDQPGASQEELVIFGDLAPPFLTSNPGFVLTH